MKRYVFGTAMVMGALALSAPQANALSCLPVADYLKDVVGKEEIVIFTATAKEQLFEEHYTAEHLVVDEGKQGYVEKELMAYHEKSRDWGYLCNAGPAKEGEKGVYVAERNAQGKYSVYQRLSPSDPLVATLESDLKTAGVEGGVSENTKEDRLNQIMTTLSDLFAEIGRLLKEYTYWKNS